MKPIYISINHLDDYCMECRLKPKTLVMLHKEENNPYGDEAIAIKIKQEIKIDILQTAPGRLQEARIPLTGYMNR